MPVIIGPSVTSPSLLGDYTYQFGDSGFQLNTDFNNTFPFVDVESITGLDSAPLRTTTNEREGQDGTYIEAEFQSMRTIVITGTVYTSNQDPESVCKVLKQQYTSSFIRPFYFKHPGQSTQFVFGQGGGAQYSIDANRRIGMTPIQLTILCSDPYIYDFPGIFEAAAFSTLAAAGFGFNLKFNFGFGGPLAISSVALPNSGTHTAYPVITLYGPLTNPAVTDSANNMTMKFLLTLAASDVLVVDCKNKAATLNAQVSRRNTLQGIKWFSVPAGVTDTFILSADSGTGLFSVLMYNTYY